MPGKITPIVNDFLVRFQTGAIKETGRRPLTFLREPMDEALIVPGCRRPGFAFWQPIAWPEGNAPIGEYAGEFHKNIVGYLSVCQTLEIRFKLPVTPAKSPLSFLYNRVFETYPNTVSSPPFRAFEEAAFAWRFNPNIPLAFCMAASCDDLEPLQMMLGASDGQMYVLRAYDPDQPVFCKIPVDRLLPKLRFVYNF
ncbi:MAG: hypothetical protein JW811_07000 [Clostridiales bacterium]|nr:hypothetical protein [Clostridiales bacterium]